MTNTGGHGVQVTKSSPIASQPNKKSTDNVVAANTIQGAEEDGVQVLGSARNQVLGNSISGGARDGIRVDSVDSILCDDNKIDGNTSISNTRWGININHPLCHNTVVGTNTLTGNGSGPIRNVGAGLTGDFDADLVTDIAEANCGSHPGDAVKRPERTDLPGDDDSDGQTNEALPAGAITFDCDGDGWNGTPEPARRSAGTVRATMASRTWWWTTGVHQAGRHRPGRTPKGRSISGSAIRTRAGTTAGLQTLVRAG